MFQQPNITLEYINGFLQAVCKLRKMRDDSPIWYEFYMEKFNKEGKSIIEFLESKINDTFIQFNKSNPNWSDNSSKKVFDDEAKLIELSNWKIDIVEYLNEWIGNDWDVLLPDIKKGTNYSQALVSEFIWVLNIFFRDTDIKLYTFNYEAVNKMRYSWGGVFYTDLFFDTPEFVYQLRFEWND